MQQYLYLFSNCVPVRGYGRSLICDLQNQRFEFIPNDLYACLLKHNNKKIIDVLNSYQKEEHQEIIQNYLNFLYIKQFIFLSPFEESFPTLSYEENQASVIYMAVFTLSKQTEAYFNKFLSFITLLNCKNLQIIIDDSFDFSSFYNYLVSIELSVVQYVEIILSYSILKSADEIIKMKSDFSIIHNICVYNTPLEQIDYIKTAIDSEIKISFALENDIEVFLSNNYTFMINQSFFIESHFSNPFYYKKIFINSLGEIKNTYKNIDSFDNISNINNIEEFQRIIQSRLFQKYWFVKKDACDICKDCEFRYICFDNRIPYKKKQFGYYYKEICNYNPYICKWEGQDKYVPVEECGTYSKENGFIPNKKKIKQLNDEIWKV